MFWIWWPGFVVPACMVLGGLVWRCIRQLPYRRKEALNPEQLLYERLPGGHGHEVVRRYIRAIRFLAGENEKREESSCR